MIVKELDRITSSDKRLQAGYKAEQQLAFYLRRAFADNPKVQVINGLRLRRPGDVAQIDHLILHNHGLIIVESKSVTTRVRVNHHGEWSRWSGKQWQGMPSPVLQAQRQADFLRQVLASLRGLKARTDFQKLPIDSLIAISDTGIINRPDNRATPNICKAEQVPDRILSLMQQHSRGEALLGWLKVVFDDSPTTLSDAALTQLAERLVRQHQPKENAPPTQKPSLKKTAVNPTSSTPIAPPKTATHKPTISEKTTTLAKVCSHCQSNRLQIIYGRYGYYFKCGDCDQNTAIKVTCPDCGQRAKLRKQKLDFFINCQHCSAQTPYFTNPAEL
ncbi:MAG: NERD domain-containing protein [Cyanobacteria bacterium J06632_22]